MLVSGILSKHHISLKKAFNTYIIPYIFFDGLYMVWLSIRGVSVSWNVLFPTYVYWYILALFFMRLILSKYKGIAIALFFFVFSFFSPFISEKLWSFLAIGRVVLLYPIFYIGYLIQPTIGEKLRKNKKLMILSVFLGVFCIVIEAKFLILNIIDVTWASHDYSSMMKDYFIKVLYIYIFAFCEFWFLCVLAPRNQCVINRWGRNSICVYLMHPFLVDIIKAFFNEMGIRNSAIVFISYFIFAFIITDFLSRSLIKRLYNTLFNKVAILLRLC